MSKKYDNEMVAKLLEMDRIRGGSDYDSVAHMTKHALRMAAAKRLQDAEERCADEIQSIFCRAMTTAQMVFTDEQMDTMRNILNMRRDARQDIENLNV